LKFLHTLMTKIKSRMIRFAVNSLVFLYSIVTLFSYASFVLDFITSLMLKKNRIRFRVIMVIRQKR